MNLVTDSKDILYIVLSVAVLWITIFFCWILYYIVAMMRDVRRGMKDFQEKIHRIDDVMHSIKDKIEHSVSLFAVLAETGRQLVGYFVTKKHDKAEKEEKGEKKKRR